MKPGVILTLASHSKMVNGAKGWCFTINNPTPEDELAVDLLGSLVCCDYLVYGNERGANGTPHYQGYVIMKTPRTLKQMKELLRTAHLEQRKGTHKQASDYCKKEGDFYEFGTLPLSAGEKTQQMWKNVILWAESGDIVRIKDEYPAIYIRYLERLRSMCRPQVAILPELENEWWYGPTGTGKSRKLWRDYPIHFAKQLNKWWDGYDGEDIVAIEEWAPKNECTASALKIWADRYPFPVEIKGGKIAKIRPRKLIVLSNYSPEQCFSSVEDLEPIRRRFKVIHFPRCVFVSDPDPESCIFGAA